MLIANGILPVQTEGVKTLAFGNAGKTFDSTKIEVAKSTDLSEYLRPGQQTVFNIGSTTNASSINSVEDAYVRTGSVTAILNVMGFLNVD